MLPQQRGSTRAKTLLAAVAALAAVALLAGCGGEEDKQGSDEPSAAPSREPTDVTCTYTEGSEPAKEAELPPEQATVSGDMTATFETSAGTFTATLDAETTPCTVNSFVSLADQGYFDDTSCHRMVTSGIYVLQCGDPSGTGAGGPGYSFEDELSGSETYSRGTLAMANAGPDTNGSQFFFVYDESPLPADYTVFGTIDEDTITAIEEVAKDGTEPPGDGAPVTPVDIESVTVE